MKVKCKECGYNRKHLGEYEDYECPICNSILNEDKEEFFDSPENETVGLDEVIRLHIIASFKRDIEKMGEKRVWKVIERLVPAEVRMRYRKFYFLAIEELKGEKNGKMC